MSPDTHYEIILYWSEEDEAIIAEVPELPPPRPNSLGIFDS